MVAATPIHHIPDLTISYQLAYSVPGLHSESLPDVQKTNLDLLDRQSLACGNSDNMTYKNNHENATNAAKPPNDETQSAVNVTSQLGRTPANANPAFESVSRTEIYKNLEEGGADVSVVDIAYGAQELGCKTAEKAKGDEDEPLIDSITLHGRRLELTRDQQEALALGNSKYPLIAIQAAFGTRKTVVGACVAIRQALAGQRVIITVSTNTAVAQFANTILEFGEAQQVGVTRFIAEAIAFDTDAPTTAVDLPEILKMIGTVFQRQLTRRKKETCRIFTQGRIRYERCCLIVKTLYGGLAEAICEELFSYGRLTCSDCIRKVSQRLEQPLNDVKEKFCRLTESQFIIKCPPVVSSLKGCPQFETSYDPYIMPEVILQGSPDEAGESRKRKQSEGDEGVYWCMNWMRFDRYIRDEMTLDLLVLKNLEKISQTLTRTVRSLLKANEIRTLPLTTINTAPISVRSQMRTNELERPDVEKALRVLVDESRGVARKSGDSGGGLFVIDFKRAVEQICQFHIESLIREQLESRAVRIFRLLQQRGHLEEDQIEKLTMMSGKETRELLYAMLEEEYVSTKPIGRTNDFAPARTFVLYYVDMPQTERGLVEYTCKMLRNIILRRSFEAKEHRQLTDRQVEMESIIETISADEALDEETKKQQIAEVEEMYMSSADRLTLERYRRAQTMLNAAETECERALFAFRLYLDFSLRRC
ncbi:unnamed protein product [Cylicocyclus nassatus]|uniref:DNA-directed RNA polymerase III subunit RPC3 n=1 Tax=Cylicocyclus nassatus TaxID=53992 RepID=A0AA36DV25_CYLNA|nr:unnamed protein product [Cylicocyclus nassatus]